jgi:crossover junction endodeoxyribonuclease RusA
MTPIEFTLPWPPSVNHYWRNFRGRMVIGERGRAYRRDAIASIRQQRIPADGVGGPLSVLVHAFPPDRRRRDLDNLQKALLDAVVAAGVIEDDSNIDELQVVRGKVQRGGMVWVRIQPYTSEIALTTRRGLEP